MEILAQIFGWVGAFLVVFAYFLVSYKKINASARVYQLMNLLGAFGVGANVFYQQAWPALAIQVVWGVIAIVALVRSKKSQS